MSDFDEARMEWQFEALREKHRECCSGAILLENGEWCNLIVPIPGPSYRGWDDPPPRSEPRSAHHLSTEGEDSA